MFCYSMALIIMIIGILPAPNDVHYNNMIEDPAGYLQISWEPPALASDELGFQNVSVNSRITHLSPMSQQHAKVY